MPDAIVQTINVLTLTGVFSCKGPCVKRTFVLSEKYRQYQMADKDDNNDIEVEGDDDDNKEDNDNDEEGEDDDDDKGDEDGSFHLSLSTRTEEVVEPKKKKVGKKLTELEYSTRSRMGPRWSKRA